MDKNVEEFIARKDERKNSANAKLKLLVYGVKPRNLWKISKFI